MPTTKQLDKLTDDFRIFEFICPCCDEAGIKMELVDRLQRAHNLLPPGSIMVITSGYRCESYTIERGRSITSSHLKGLAADISCTSSGQRFQLVKALQGAGFTRIGIGPNFVHVDIDRDKIPDLIWTYYGENK